MRTDNRPEIIENIEYMLRIGMKPGEIQTIYPNLDSGVIRNISKKIGIPTVLKDNEIVRKRNNETIKKFLKNYIEQYKDEKDVSKIQLLMECIDYMEPTANRVSRTRKFMQTKMKNNQKEQIEEEER